MGTYSITIDRLDNPTDEPTITVIECTTRYTLQEDIVEWVREEIDADATVQFIPKETLVEDEDRNGADKCHEPKIGQARKPSSARTA